MGVPVVGFPDPVEEAAEEVRKRIERDRAYKPLKVQTMLRRVEEGFLDPDFDVGALIRSFGRGGRYAAELFAERLLTPPGTYISHRRVDVAKILLRRTEMWVNQVAVHAGFGSRVKLYRNFMRITGEPPSAYRSNARSQPPKISDRPATGRERALDSGYSGTLVPDQAEELQEENRKPGLCAPTRATRQSRLVDDDCHEARAQLTLGLLRHTDQAYHRLVLELADVRSPKLFELLHKESRNQGRSDRQLGVHLAQLGLESLDYCAEELGDAIHDRRTIAWAWLGKAHLLNLDQRAAENAFAAGRREWETTRENPDPLAYSEVLWLESHLRLLQRRHSAALDLLDQAIPPLRRSGKSEALVMALITKSNIAFFMAEHSHAIPLLAEAQDLLGPEDDPLLRFAVFANMAANLTGLRQYREAKSFLCLAKDVCDEIEVNRLFRSQLAWTEGLVEQGRGDLALARALLIEARSEFIDLGEIDHASVISLDLAIHCLNSRLFKEAREILLETLPILQTLKSNSEICLGLQLLENACIAETLDLRSLWDLRSKLEKLRSDPARQLGL